MSLREARLKVSTMSPGHVPYIPKPPGFQQKAAYPQHFTTARACPGYSEAELPHELYPLCSNFKSGGSLKRQLPRNPRSRTFEGGPRPGYPPRTSARIPQRSGPVAMWMLNKDSGTHIMSSPAAIYSPDNLSRPRSRVVAVAMSRLVFPRYLAKLRGGHYATRPK